LKSAGSLFYGGGAYYTMARNDSGFIFNHPTLGGHPNFTRIRNYSIGLSVGYGYTFVFAENFFASAMATLQPTLGFSLTSLDSVKNNQTSFRYSYFVRTAAGYWHNKFSIAAFWVNDGIFTSSGDYNFNFYTGRFRLAFNYRFLAGPKTQHTLRFVDVVEERVIKKIKSR
jgi:hypothetical protein